MKLYIICIVGFKNSTDTPEVRSTFCPAETPEMATEISVRIREKYFNEADGYIRTLTHIEEQNKEEVRLMLRNNVRIKICEPSAAASDWQSKLGYKTGKPVKRGH